jgi:hypothetical protein
MGLKKLQYKIVKRWLPEEFDWKDEYGDWHRTANPEPEVQILSGIYRQGEGEMIHSILSSIEFQSITGRPVFGGNYEKPGIHEIWIDETIFDIIKPRFNRSTTKSTQDRKTPVAKTKVDKIEEIRQGRLHVREGVKCLVRKKS